ncbi:hypothetical protein AMTR_s00040p00070450 [Amborella trichopoda]|uniref:Alcohol dehydrogenase-like C-terminal domain-containing protein n=1 Tax=Amborella trichopoda TaxID=13333 RepID=W1PY60_AMBTC|nr:hypothetical protein AMTR_s00040p00070450 [Amborella trichopoda]
MGLYAVLPAHNNGTLASRGGFFGGCSDKIVVHKCYVLHIPGPPCIAPMKYYGHTQPSRCLGVVGLGGLGHIAVKFVKAYLLKVTGISTSPIKDKEAMERLKVEKFLVSRDSEQMKAVDCGRRPLLRPKIAHVSGCDVSSYALYQRAQEAECYVAVGEAF